MLTEMDLCAIAQKWVYKMVDDSLVAGDALKDIDALVAALRDARAERDAALSEIEILRAQRDGARAARDEALVAVDVNMAGWKDTIDIAREALAGRDAALAENKALRRVAHAFNEFQQHPLIPRWDDTDMYQNPGSLWDLVRIGREALAAVPPRGELAAGKNGGVENE